MLAEFMQYLETKISTNNKDKLRVLKTPDSVPGVLNIARMQPDGTFDIGVVDYQVSPVRYVAKTLGAFVMTLKRVLGDSGFSDIFIGSGQIVAYVYEGESTKLHERDMVTLKLEATPAWDFVAKKHCSPAIGLKYAIKELFTGYPNGGSSPILSLIPLLSKVIVNESKKVVADNNKAMNSIGLDVQQSLNLNDSEIPEEVMCPVSVYKQHDYIHYVKMLFRYDFEQMKFILSPIQHDLDEAVDTTVGELMETIEEDGGLPRDRITVYPCDAIIPTGSAELR